MIIETLASALLAQPVGGEFEFGIVKMVDRGRLTPFGRTYDVYLDTNGRVPRSFTQDVRGSAILTMCLARWILEAKKKKMLSLRQLQR